MQGEVVRDVLSYVGLGGVVSAAESLIAPPREPRSPLLPRGPVIGGVWSALFAAMGVARARLHRHPRQQLMLDGLWLLCVTYPLYTGGMRRRGATYAGNLAVAGAATALAARTRRSEPVAAGLILPVALWAGWATLGLLTERKSRGPRPTRSGLPG